jgi:uncharacterized membrane protein
MRLLWMLVVVLFLFGCGQKGPEPVSFREQIQPILSDRCVRCHGAEQTLGKVVLTSYEGMMTSRTHPGKKRLVVPDTLRESWLYLLCATDQPHYRMPPDTSNITPLPQNELDLIARWIMQGAKNN